MTTPRLEIKLDKLAHNARELVTLFGARGIGLTAITKGVRGSPEVAALLLSSGIKSLGDSRLANISRMRDAGLRAEYMLTRSPKLSEVERVVELVDVSLNSEIRVVRQLARCAARLDRVHRVILMVELGDLREGILPADLDPVVEETLSLEGIELIGIGTNLACFGGVAPTAAKMRQLSSLARNVQQRHGIKLQIVSGGNSANYQWFVSSSNLALVNHLRIGEAILLGCDSLTRRPIPNLYTDAFTLVAEIIELKVKPSRPYGRPGQDAFGRMPRFKDKGPMRRAILALGEQDVEASRLKPRIAADVVGASSDHLILDAGDALLTVGSEVQFDLGYGALLRAMTSPYVLKVYVGHAPLDRRLQHIGRKAALHPQPLAFPNQQPLRHADDEDQAHGE